MNRLAVLAMVCCVPVLTAAQSPPARGDAGFVYRFSRETPVSYRFTADGDVSFGYEGTGTETLKVKMSAVLPLALKDARDGVFSIEIAPKKTKIQVNDTILEDLTGAESVSAALTAVSLSLADSGRVITTEDRSAGIVSIGKLLCLIPAFPAPTLTPGRRWKQTVSALSFPGIPMPDLEFWYVYDGMKPQGASFTLTGDQIIKQTKRQGDVAVTMNGRARGAGKLFFSTDQGRIEQSSGTIDLNLRVIFGLPPVPGEKGGQSLPMTVNMKMSYGLTRLDQDH